MKHIVGDGSGAVEDAAIASLPDNEQLFAELLHRRGVCRRTIQPGMDQMSKQLEKSALLVKALARRYDCGAFTEDTTVPA